MDNIANKTQTFSVNPDNLLLRGSSLCNTDYVYGVVVYSGHNTKIMKNSNISRTKVSKNDAFTYR